MDATTPHDDLPPLARGGEIPRSVPIGTVVDRWECPCCDQVIEVVHRPGRPRIYCSQACRQRAFRWRQQHGVHTVSTPDWPAEQSFVHGGRHHALRDGRDPMSRRRDRRGREATACGVLAHPSLPSRQQAHRAPFLGAASSSACRSCIGLTTPRPLGLVPPGAVTPVRPPDKNSVAFVQALHAIDENYPLDPKLRHLLATLWAA